MIPEGNPSLRWFRGITRSRAERAQGAEAASVDWLGGETE